MPSFILPDAPGAYKYRPLKKGDQGWDAYALQTGLAECGYGIGASGADGFLGADSDSAIRAFQAEHGLVEDGIAGVITQTYVIKTLAPLATAAHSLPRNALKGQIEKESGNWLGNHSVTYSDGSLDIGVTQRNTRYSSYDDGFDVADSIDYLARTIRGHFDAFSDPSCAERLRARGLPQTDPRRRWELAMGAWNRPAYASYLAGRPMGESLKPTQTQIDWLEAYIARVTVYITKYPTN